jgi:serine protease Do
MGRRFAAALLICASIAWSPVLAQVPDIRGGQIPTLAPVVKETTPSVVNISVHARVKEDNPLYCSRLASAQTYRREGPDKIAHTEM